MMPVKIVEPGIFTPLSSSAYSHCASRTLTSGRGSLPLHHLVSDSAHPHNVSDPLPQSFVGSSQHWTALNLDPEGSPRVL